MATFEELDPVEVTVPPVFAVQVARRTDPASIPDAMQSAFGELMALVGRDGLIPAGPPRAIYTAYGPDGVSFLVAMPIAVPPGGLTGEGAVTLGQLPAGKALRFTHRGPYGDLKATYSRITQFMQAKGMLKNEADWARYMPMWEEYLNDPGTTPEVELLTHIYVPLP